MVPESPNNLYADDTAVYSAAPSPSRAVREVPEEEKPQKKQHRAEMSLRAWMINGHQVHVSHLWNKWSSTGILLPKQKLF